MYNKDYYKENKERFLEWQRKYRLKNKEKIKQKRKQYDEKNHDKIMNLKREWIKNNIERVKAQKKKDDKKYYENNKQKISLIRKTKRPEYYQRNKDKIKAYYKAHAQLPHVKARRNLMERLRRKENPQSNRSLPLELQFAMNRVRLRDGNRCKWQGCNITHKQDKIHVHHIFPRSEHPELELEERYMICYCSTHHRQFHRMRGDVYSEMIKPNPDLEHDSVSGRD